MKRKNMISMVTSLALVGAVAVGGTLALLSQQSNAVTNTFTIGNGYGNNAFYLDEAVVEQVKSGTVNFGGYEAKTPSERTRTKNEYNNLVAETTLDKDPTFHLAAGSPDSWIVAHITGLDELQAQGVELMGSADEIELPANYKWQKLNTVDNTLEEVDDYTDLTNGYYVVSEPVEGGAEIAALFTKLEVTENVRRPGDGKKPVLANGKLSEIVITGVAVESLNGTWEEDKAAVIAQINEDASGFFS